MLEDQAYILGEILTLVDREQPEGVIIAGDVYDKSVPACEAVGMLDDFLTELVARRIKIFIVSGNHDSAERLGFGSRIMEKNGLHIAGSFQGGMEKVTLEDEFGPLHVHLLPFIKPAMVGGYFPDAEIATYHEAVNQVIRAGAVDMAGRNILIAHQFVTSGNAEPERSESETASVGGLDNVDASIFEDFDYVALGHLHGPQSIGREMVRYAGSPLKYSFSEVHQQKSVAMVTLGAKGDVSLELLGLAPRVEMRELKGQLSQLIAAAQADQEGNKDYIRAILTDEGEIYDAVGQLRRVFPNFMRIEFAQQSREQSEDSRTAASGDVACKTPLELFGEFYHDQLDRELDQAQLNLLAEVFARVGGMPE